MTHPARQRAHNLLFNALTRAIAVAHIRDVAPCTDRDLFIKLSDRETITRLIIDDLARYDAAIYAHPEPVAVNTDDSRKSQLEHAAERLAVLAGPDGASTTIDVNRRELADLAALIARAAQPARPFHGDYLDYTELPEHALGLRMAIAILANTGTTVEVPRDYAPDPTVLEIISGWTIQARITAGTAPGTVAISASPRQLPPALTNPRPLTVDDALAIADAIEDGTA